MSSSRSPIRKRKSVTAASLARCLCDFDDLGRCQFWLAPVAELLGTLFFVCFGTGSTLTFSFKTTGGKVDVVRQSLSFGLGIALMVQVFGPISGGHFNPAVTLAMMTTGKVGLCRCLVYTFAQILGAILGSAFLYLVTPPSAHGRLGVNGLGEGVTQSQGFLIEMVMTCLLLLVICASVDSTRSGKTSSLAPIMIGISVTYAHLFGIPYTGASFDPARSFGPALVADNFKDHWIYWAGPLIGGPLGANLYKLFVKLFRPEPPARIEVVMNCKQKINGIRRTNDLAAIGRVTEV